MSQPEMKDDPLYLLLRNTKVEEFNTLKAKGHTADLAGGDYRGLDLRGIDAQGLDFSNSYFRQADLRGVDLSKTNMEGASINGAKISGAYFPHELPAEEIRLSLLHGTRMRYQCGSSKGAD